MGTHRRAPEKRDRVSPTHTKCHIQCIIKVPHTRTRLRDCVQPKRNAGPARGTCVRVTLATAISREMIQRLVHPRRHHATRRPGIPRSHPCIGACTSARDHATSDPPPERDVPCHRTTKSPHLCASGERARRPQAPQQVVVKRHGAHTVRKLRNDPSSQEHPQSTPFGFPSRRPCVHRKGHITLSCMRHTNDDRPSAAHWTLHAVLISW